jgi:hypothetical protein
MEFFDYNPQREGSGPVTLLGILLIVFTCLMAVGIGYVTNENIQNFNEKSYVNFLGGRRKGG